MAHHEKGREIDESGRRNLGQAEADKFERRSEQEHRQRNDRRGKSPREPRQRRHDAIGKQHDDRDGRGIPVRLSDARVAENHVQQPGDPAKQRLVPERGLAALEPVMLHEDAIRKSLEQEVVVADAVQRPASNLIRVGGGDVGKPRHDDQEEQPARVPEAAANRHQERQQYGCGRVPRALLRQIAS